MDLTNYETFKNMSKKQLVEAATIMELVVKKLDGELDIKNAPMTDAKGEKMIEWIKIMTCYNACLMYRGLTINGDSELNKILNDGVDHLVKIDYERLSKHVPDICQPS